MKQAPGKITLLVDKNKTTIEIHDPLSGLISATVTLTAEQFCAALGRLSHCDCLVQYGALHNIGKVQEIMTHEFELSKKIGSIYDLGVEDKIYQIAKDTCPEGWEPDKYFRSQKTFFDKDGKRYARTTARRWVENTEVK